MKPSMALREIARRYLVIGGGAGIDGRYPIDAQFADPNGVVSILRYFPSFVAVQALTAKAAAGTWSNVISDWMGWTSIPSGCVLGTDYQVYGMGGFWADLYLCSSHDATTASQGTPATGSGDNLTYHSRLGVAPRVSQNISHYKTTLANRFGAGSGFLPGYGPQGLSWVGKGGLMTNQHWQELWVWSRIKRVVLVGNTLGYDGTNPLLPTDRYGAHGYQDTSQPLAYGCGVTGGGPASWSAVIDAFCGERWEFVRGFMEYNGVLYSAGKNLAAGVTYTDAAYMSTGISIAALVSGVSPLTFRTEAALAVHGIPATTTTAGTGPFDGMGFWHTADSGRVARRGGSCLTGAVCPGALSVADAPSVANWRVGARAVLVP